MYAKKTKVPVERSEAEIRRLLTRYGADHLALGLSSLQAAIGFQAKGRYVRFILPLTGTDTAESRRRWRALALVIKAKLEAVNSKITTFEHEFMAHIVMPDGKTVGEHISPRIEEAYQTGRVPPLLLPAGPPEA